ncbi:hypothetical protein A54_136 [Septuagintavirus sv54]|uniref:Uncharacterized protein n=1 Tax=Escherichia phage A5-4 TaxID=2996162 RepID=A0AAE9TJC9_9CAUD|nr:hypothetical protein A54_136 [Escherichia phage A5-4]
MSLYDKNMKGFFNNTGGNTFVKTGASPTPMQGFPFPNPPTTTIDREGAISQGFMAKLLTLKYKGILIEGVFNEEILDFFADPMNIEKEEVLLLEAANPKWAEILKSAFRRGWLKEQADKVFYE